MRRFPRAPAIADDRTELISRRRDVYKSFGPLVAELGLALAGNQGVMDGEIVCLDSAGRPQFYDLVRRRGQPFFIAFDVLHLVASTTVQYKDRSYSRLAVAVILGECGCGVAKWWSARIRAPAGQQNSPPHRWMVQSRH